MYNRPGRMAGIYRSGNHDQAKAYFIFRSDEPIGYGHRDVDQQKRLVSDAFAGDSSWRTGGLPAAALADPDFCFDALSQVRMESWSRGRGVTSNPWCPGAAEPVRSRRARPGGRVLGSP